MPLHDFSICTDIWLKSLMAAELVANTEKWVFGRREVSAISLSVSRVLRPFQDQTKGKLAFTCGWLLAQSCVRSVWLKQALCGEHLHHTPNCFCSADWCFKHEACFVPAGKGGRPHQWVTRDKSYQSVRPDCSSFPTFHHKKKRPCLDQSLVSLLKTI